MKMHFINMFRYDRNANFQMLGLIGDAGNPVKPVQLLAHVLGAQQVWLNRCSEKNFVGSAVWPEWKAAQLGAAIEESHRRWLTFIEGIEEKDWEEYIIYKNSKGIQHKRRLIDILAHVINHGTHHRAQIGQLLKREGENLPATDYILYMREQ